MRLTLFKGDRLSRLDLPEKVAGKFWIAAADDAGHRSNMVGVEAVNGRWTAKSSKTAALLDPAGSKLRECVLEEGAFYGVLETATGERALLHVEASSADRKHYAKYLLPESGTVTIGRADGCDVRFTNELVSAHHAELIVEPHLVRIRDTQSTNGTFVNDVRVSESNLLPGDVVSVMGLQIVVGGGFIALNNPDGRVFVNNDVLRPMLIEAAGDLPDDDDIEETRAGVVFFRSPRFKKNLVAYAVKIDAPPPRDAGEETPLMMVLGPALTMGMASLFMGIFAVSNVLSSGGSLGQAMPTLMMSVSMLGGMVLWPVANRRYEKRRRLHREVGRQQKYKAYISALRRSLEEEKERQTHLLREMIVPVEDCVERIATLRRDLWERTSDHDDFLRVRLGIGDIPMLVDLRYPERKFSIEEDALLEEMYALAEEPKILRSVPVSVSLRDQPVMGLIGEQSQADALLRNIVIQLAALHSYDELKMALFYDEPNSGEWEFARWFPHTRFEEEGVTLAASNAAEARELAAVLDRELVRRITSGSVADSSAHKPHVVVIAADDCASSKAGLLDKVLQDGGPHGFSVIVLGRQLQDLPKECRVIIDSGKEARIYNRDDTTGSHIAFAPDPGIGDGIRDLAVKLSNTRIGTLDADKVLPDVVTFLELYEVGRVEHLNVLTRWRENNPVASLEAPVGVDSRGQTFKLDLHERAHGPHGLVAGMTGSGKSEFIMAYLLSLAVNYHPDEVAFVLIDYKGGGMANALADLPHVAGTITNLDGAAVNRSLISIQSELKRRQTVFNAASERTGVSNIDIYKYQSLYRSGQVTQPMPHLIIVADEFAELKAQQPEFMTQLVSAARIGRSLGVHLVLATQKPSGVVDEQIWSNSRFRVCLKVQEAADSMEVIKRPDAAELAATGRFYLQVGFNELFEMGQSAWAGAPYYPSDRPERTYDNSVVVLGALGRPLRQARLDRRRSTSANPAKQIDEITEYLVDLAAQERIRTRPLWLEPLSADITIDEVEKRHKVPKPSPFVLNPLIGEYDDPARQHQGPLAVPLTEHGNVLVYGSLGSGKTEFLFALLYSLLKSHSPDEVNIYALDFGAETLRAFKGAPHVGDVLFSSDEEKIANLFKMLRTEIVRRRSLYADFGGDHRTYCARSGATMPSIVVVINNYAAFAETYEDFEEAVGFLSREGARYGVEFVVTATAPGAIRYRIAQNFKSVYVMQMNDPSDYAGVLGNTGGVVPSPLTGRGIFRADAVYEFQTARLTRGEDVQSHVQQFCEGLSNAWGGLRARRIPVLPERVTPSFLAEDIKGLAAGVVPVGIDKADLQPVMLDLKSRLVTLVLTQGADMSPFLAGLAEALGAQSDIDCIVVDALGLMSEDSIGISSYAGIGVLDNAVQELFEETLRRNSAAVEARELGSKPTPERQRLYLLVGLGDLLSQLSSTARVNLQTVFEKCDASLGVTFLVADLVSSFSTLAYEPWLKRHLSPGDGIWIGDGLTEQFVLQPSKTTSDMYGPIADEFGYVLTRGTARVVKLLTSEDAARGVPLS